MSSIFHHLLESVDVSAGMDSLGHLKIWLEDPNPEVLQAIAATNKNGDTTGSIEAKLDDIDEAGTPLTQIDTFLNRFNVSEEDRERLDEDSDTIILKMPAMEFANLILVRYGCVQYQQQELSQDYIDWLIATGRTK